MNVLINYTIVILFFIYVSLILIFRKFSWTKTGISNPNFTSFQKSYLLPFFLVSVADWLQAPYLYLLFYEYGFLTDQIGVIYVTGFLANMVASIYSSAIIERFPRKLLIVTFTLMVILSCISKSSRDYFTLIGGRIFGGFATSLLFPTYSSWYIHQHRVFHDFPEEWIEETFRFAAFWNGVIAVFCGIFSFVIADQLHFGPVSPFLISIIPLVLSMTIVLVTWEENSGSSPISCRQDCFKGLFTIVNDSRLLCLGLYQSAFEAVLYVIVYLWNPIIQHYHHIQINLGLVFSSFMICIMIGTLLHSVVPQVFKRYSLILVMLIAGLTMLVLAYSTNVYIRNHNSELAFFALLAFETVCGFHIPNMNFLQKTLAKTTPPSVFNWTRLPINAAVCVAILLNKSSNKICETMQICCLILFGGFFVSCILFRLLKSKNGDGAAETET